MNRASFALLATFVVALALGESPEPAKIRITTWNLEWFPNGSAHDATPEVQGQRIAAAADVLRPIMAQFEIWYGRIYSKGKPDSSARACKPSCRLFSSVSRCLPTFFSALVKYRA